MSTLDTYLAAERERAELHRRKLDAIQTTLAPLTMGPNSDNRARALAFAIIASLLHRFALHASFAGSLGQAFARQLADVDKALGAAQEAERAPMWREALLDACVRADSLASLLCSHVGPRGAWALELQVPFDLATMLRRACEHNAADFLALVVLDAQRLLTVTALRETPEPIDRLICEAVGVTGAALAVAFAPEPVPLVDAARTAGVYEEEPC